MTPSGSQELCRKCREKMEGERERRLGGSGVGEGKAGFFSLSYY